MNDSKQQGITLVEMMLVLIIVAGICMSGISLYKRYRWRNQLATIRTSVDQMAHMSSVYFSQKCKEMGWQLPVTVSEGDLLETGALPHEHVLKNPWGGPFVATIDNINDSINITVTTQFTHLPETCHHEDCHRILRAEGVENEFNWRTTRMQLLKTINTHLWMLKNNLYDFAKRFARRETNAACF